MLIWQKYLKVLGQVSSTLPSSTIKYQVLLYFKVSSTSKYQVLKILHQVPSTSTLLDPNPDIVQEIIFGSKKITEACNPKMVFKMCEGILSSSFSVKELNVIVHKKCFLVKHYQILAIRYPTSLANLAVEVGTRHRHQILLD